MGVIFPPFLLVVLSPGLLYNKCWLDNKALLTIHGVVFLLQETEPLFLKKITYN